MAGCRCKGKCLIENGPCGERISSAHTEYTFHGWYQCRTCEAYLQNHYRKQREGHIGGEFCYCCGCYMSRWPPSPESRQLFKRMARVFPNRTYENRKQIYAVAREANLIGAVS
jgi:hypothetical protein